jgi:hypothetical protein
MNDRYQKVILYNSFGLYVVTDKHQERHGTGATLSQKRFHFDPRRRQQCKHRCFDATALLTLTLPIECSSLPDLRSYITFPKEINSHAVPLTFSQLLAQGFFQVRASCMWPMDQINHFYIRI